MIQYTSVCPFCMKKPAKGEVSSMTYSFDGLVGKDNPKILKVCKACKRAVDYIGLHANRQRQNSHFEEGNTPSKHEDLGPVSKPFNRIMSVRVDAQGVEHRLCKCCLVWKPATLDYFAKWGVAFKPDTLSLDKVCLGCREISFRTLPEDYLRKVKAETKEKIAADHASQLRKVRSKLRTDNKKSVYLVQYVDGGGLVSIHTIREAAIKEANTLSLKHDPQFKKTGMKLVFKVTKAPLKTP